MVSHQGANDHKYSKLARGKIRLPCTTMEVSDGSTLLIPPVVINHNDHKGSFSLIKVLYPRCKRLCYHLGVTWNCKTTAGDITHVMSALEACIFGIRCVHAPSTNKYTLRIRDINLSYKISFNEDETVDGMINKTNQTLRGELYGSLDTTYELRWHSSGESDEQTSLFVRRLHLLSVSTHSRDIDLESNDDVNTVIDNGKYSSSACTPTNQFVCCSSLGLEGLLPMSNVDIKRNTANASNEHESKDVSNTETGIDSEATETDSGEGVGSTNQKASGLLIMTALDIPKKPIEPVHVHNLYSTTDIPMSDLGLLVVSADQRKRMRLDIGHKENPKRVALAAPRHQDTSMSGKCLHKYKADSDADSDADIDSDSDSVNISDSDSDTKVESDSVNVSDSDSDTKVDSDSVNVSDSDSDTKDDTKVDVDSDTVYDGSTTETDTDIEATSKSSCTYKNGSCSKDTDSPRTENEGRQTSVSVPAPIQIQVQEPTTEVKAADKVDCPLVVIGDKTGHSRCVPNNMPMYIEQPNGCLDVNIAHTNKQGIRSYTRDSSSWRAAVETGKQNPGELVRVPTVDCFLIANGCVFHANTDAMVVVAVNKKECKELHASLYGMDSKRSAFVFAPAKLTNVFFSITSTGRFGVIRGVFSVMKPPSTIQSDGITYIEEVTLPVTAIIGSLSNFNPAQLRYLTPEYAEFVTTSDAHRDVTTRDMNAECTLMSSAGCNSTAMLHSSNEYMHTTDVGIGMYTHVGRVILHVFSRLLSTIGINTAHVRDQLLHHCLIGGIEFTTSECMSYVAYVNHECVLCKRELPTAACPGEKTLNMRIGCTRHYNCEKCSTTITNENSGRVHAVCWGVMQKAYSIVHGTQCIRYRFREASGLARVTDYCPCTVDCPHTCLVSGVDSVRYLISFIKRYI
jgi:hypothetical protein